MKVYLTHSSGYDYESELYEPLRRSLAKRVDIFFPHSKENINTKSKDVIAVSDVVLAEVSYPSTGQGIELGWADASSTRIVCFYRSGSKISSSLRFISNEHIEYTTADDMVAKLDEWFHVHNEHVEPSVN